MLYHVLLLKLPNFAIGQSYTPDASDSLPIGCTNAHFIVWVLELVLTALSSSRELSGQTDFRALLFHFEPFSTKLVTKTRPILQLILRFLFAFRLR